MATDWWPSQEGRIADGLTINCIAGTAVAEGDAVKFGTSTLSQITVVPGTEHGDSWGIAIRAAAAGMPVPVLVYGLYKCIMSTVANGEQGQACANYANNAVTSCEDLGLLEATAIPFGGVSIVLGMLMQTATAAADEILVLVGKCI